MADKSVTKYRQNEPYSSYEMVRLPEGAHLGGGWKIVIRDLYTVTDYDGYIYHLPPNPEGENEIDVSDSQGAPLVIGSATLALQVVYALNTAYHRGITEGVARGRQEKEVTK